LRLRCIFLTREWRTLVGDINGLPSSNTWTTCETISSISFSTE
jgi:hypothetical protein